MSVTLVCDPSDFGRTDIGDLDVNCRQPAASPSLLGSMETTVGCFGRTSGARAMLHRLCTFRLCRGFYMSRSRLATRSVDERVLGPDGVRHRDVHIGSAPPGLAPVALTKAMGVRVQAVPTPCGFRVGQR